MPFYRGDYYRGDYYRGDPYIGIIRGAAKAWKGAKWLAGAARRTFGGRRAAQTARDVTVGMAGYGVGRAGGPPSTLMPGGTIPQGGTRPGTAVVPYVSRCSGVARGSDEWYAMGCHRRKMNPLNPKALRRALRRTEGFEKFAARTVNALYRVIDGRKVRTFKKKAT